MNDVHNYIFLLIYFEFICLYFVDIFVK